MVIAFGVLAVVLALFGPFLIGWVGFAIVAVLAGLAIFFQIRKNSLVEEGGRKKKAGLVLGIIGAVLALLIQIGLMGVADKIKEQANKMGDEFAVVAYASDGFKTLGIVGFLSKAMDKKPEGMSDQDFMTQVSDDFSKVSKEMSNK